MAITRYKLSNGEYRWRIRTYLGINPDTGKEIRLVKSNYKSEREAKLAGSRFIIDYEENKHNYQKNNYNYKFKEVAELWLTQYKNTVKEVTYMSGKHLIEKKLYPIFGNYYIDKIPVRLCQSSINEWYETYTKSNLIVSYFNQITDFAISLGYCNDNPMKRTVRPKNSHKKDYDAPFYNKEQLKILFEKTKKSEDFRYYAMFRVLAYTGLRRGELLGLRWSDIDFKQQLLSVNRVLAKGLNGPTLQTPKTKSSKRTIAVDQETLNTLQQWKIKQQRNLMRHGVTFLKEDNLVFINEYNKPIRIDRPGKVLQRVIERHNLDYINLHGFRHTHCSLLFEAGIEMQDVKDRLGHSDITTTMNIYTHVTPKQREKVADQFAKFMMNS